MFEPDQILQYVHGVTRESDVARRLREHTATFPNAEMQISPDQAAFLSFLVSALGARKAIELGTFTGYSALAIATALPPDGTLVCCDVRTDWTNVGRAYWREAGVESRIDLRIGPAVDTIRTLIDGGGAGTFDFAFIDADKREYETYYELILQLLRPGGVAALDNMLWDGKVADPHDHDHDPATRVLRALNATIAEDQRVDASLLTVRDGVMLVRKR